MKTSIVKDENIPLLPAEGFDEFSQEITKSYAILCIKKLVEELMVAS